MLKGAACAAILAAGALSGCANAPREIPVTSPATRAVVTDALGEAAANAAKAQETLARVQVSRTKPTPSSLDVAGLPEELRRPATLDWSGPAHESAEKVAKLIGYRFAIVGNPPSIPPIIHVTLVDVPAAKALEQIGLQSFPFGEVVVDPNGKRVEFRYLQSSQQPRSAAGTSPSLGPSK
jgi:defect-in-organelle-trafficking protein DotD